MNKPQIIKCCAREILDSRGVPTVEASVFLSDGTVGMASVPSGASTGIYEVHEKRDNNGERFFGKGVRDAVSSVCRVISPAVSGISACEQYELDKLLIYLDGTPDRSSLGANAILSVSLAAARAAANWYHIPLYRYLGGAAACRLPIPMMNILNGGKHASNNVEIQEFMIVPHGFDSFSEALRAGSEIYHALGEVLKKNRLSASVGDEGGYAPELDNDEQALEFIVRAIRQAGYSTEKVGIALDAAASEWFSEETGTYRLGKRGAEYTSEGLCAYWERLCRSFPVIMSLEDPLDQRDIEGWRSATERLGGNIMLVGDDLFVTNNSRLKEGARKGLANTVLIKPNQIGTLSETLEVIGTARDLGYGYIISHRSGETEDTTIADIAVATNAQYVKMGAPCRSERTAKYNRLLRIESALNSGAKFGSEKLR